MKLENVILAFIAVVAVIIVPITSPELAASVGGAFDIPLGFVTSLLSTIFDGLAEFQGDLWQYLLGAGISAPLTFGIVAVLRKIKRLENISGQALALIVGFIIYVIMIVAQNAGQGAAFDTWIQIAVLALSVFAGTATTQFGASSIHDKFVDSSLAIAYKRNEAQ